jgi:iron complex transport system permease protein
MSFVAATARLTRGRQVATIAACALLACGVALLGPMLGVEMTRSGRALTLADLGRALDPATTDYQIFVYGRLARAIAALLVGGALAAAGCAFQAILRNPLAEPFTLGISSGSTLAAVIAIHLGVDSVFGASGVGVAAVMGAAAAVALVWSLGRVGNALPPATLLLAGVSVAMACSAAAMLIQFVADFSEVSRMVRWMMGDFAFVRWSTIGRAGPAIGIGLLALLIQARDLNALAAGPEAAASVGVSVGRAQSITFVAASLMVGASIAVAGPVGFVGLMVPHAMRLFVGPDHRVLLPVSILAGGALLVVCDTAARLAVSPGGGLPVDIITSMMGAPFLVLLVVRAKRSASLWGR